MNEIKVFGRYGYSPTYAERIKEKPEKQKNEIRKNLKKSLGRTKGAGILINNMLNRYC
jgi:hypothetical protein